MEIDQRPEQFDASGANLGDVWQISKAATLVLICAEKNFGMKILEVLQLKHQAQERFNGSRDMQPVAIAADAIQRIKYIELMRILRPGEPDWPC
jgi:hypothetical protein